MTVCVACGVEFVPLRKAGPPRITCGAECQRARELERMRKRKTLEGPPLAPRRKRSSLPPEEEAKRDKRIADAVRDGVPTGELVKRFRVSQDTVRRVARAAGVTFLGSTMPFGAP